MKYYCPYCHREVLPEEETEYRVYYYGGGIMFKDYTCPKCGYTWQPRTEKPIECPNCKKRLWKYVKPIEEVKKN